jgi:predicted transposase YdaD
MNSGTYAFKMAELADGAWRPPPPGGRREGSCAEPLKRGLAGCCVSISPDTIYACFWLRLSVGFGGMTHPYERSFRNTFSTPENATQLIRGNLPVDISERIDWASIEDISGFFFDKESAWRHKDLLFRASLAGREAYIYLLLEHQRTSESQIAVQLLGYLARIWEKVLINKPKTKEIPPVIPLVFYHGAKGWHAAKSFRDLIDFDDHLIRAIAPQIPDYRYIFDNLSDQSDEQLQARVLGEVGMLALLFLQRLPDHPDPEAVLRIVTNLATSVVTAPSRVESLGMLVWYAFRASDPDTSRLRQWIEANVGEHVIEAYKTSAERMTEETRKTALAEGRAEGRAEMLRRLLTLKFGALSAESEARLGKASVSDLDRWAERVLSAQRIDDVFV